jgi:hypothetical protein
MNRAQKRQLQAYMHFHHRPMSVLALIRFNWRVLLLAGMAGLTTVGLMLFFNDVFFASVFGAAYAGILGRDLGQFIRWSRTWEMTRELLDWSKLERLASESGVAV